MRFLDRLVDRLAMRVWADHSPLAAMLRRRLDRIDEVLAELYARPSANARTYEVGYDEHGNGIVRSEPMPPADHARGARFAVGHDNLRNGSKS